MKFATGKFALAICDRCGLQAPYNMLVPDGYTPGMRVHQSCFDTKHPAEEPFRTDEGIALKNPRPNREDMTVGDITDTTGTAQAGSANTITLASTASADHGAYVNCAITLTGGPGSGLGSGSVRTIQAYNGTTKVAAVAAWVTPPNGTTTYSVDVPLLAGRLGFDNYFGGAT